MTLRSKIIPIGTLVHIVIPADPRISDGKDYCGYGEITGPASLDAYPNSVVAVKLIGPPRKGSNSTCVSKLGWGYGTTRDCSMIYLEPLSPLEHLAVTAE